MRGLILLVATLLAAPALADWDDYDYIEERELSVAAGGVDEFVIEAGAGSLKIEGERGADAIMVRATIQVSGAEDDKARDFIAKRMELSLESDGDRAFLVSGFRDGGMGWGNKSGAIALDIVIPEGMALEIDDGSGSIVITDTLADIRLDDGSGSIKIRGAGNIKVDDGSGSIDISDASGNVRVDDGSGSVTVVGVAGNVSVDDGSGSIKVRDVQGDFRVIDDGSGSINYSNVLGQVDVPED